VSKKDVRVVWVPPSAFGSPLFLCACRALSRLFVAAVCRVWWFVVSFFLVRLLLSVWVLLPGPRWGRGCGSLRAVWFGGSLSFFGGAGPARDLSLPLAWELLWSGFRC